MLWPRARLQSVTEITPLWLRERGLRGVILDLDNTLVPYGFYGEPPAHLVGWLEELKAAGIPLVLVSNGSRARVGYWREKLGVLGLGPAGKPWCGFRSALRRMGLQACEVAVVGDQLFTDVLGGNLVGAYTVLVPPLSSRELGYTRLVRRLERFVLRVLLAEEFDPGKTRQGPTIKKE
ncbi:YqeG family HAD IIIA-type phosphatase [Meiothermus sp. QL-1]|uniref:YqeG family HAD IIIA-type phosphatase n=1 Tax=Meiothermus sp. QL-1 TaxID=2058095 RepID=UPI000E0ADD7E|nr:YqeG family HAD IIIA-type phosphatase [Meiothermus sp. QL-1]RDI96649.1 YqeG family HAD IIIA-type phosphatase [Meiothermus sp. QL-1]